MIADESSDARPQPNLSTEHRHAGDASSPRDTPDRGEDTPGGQSPETGEDRPVVGTVKPEDYPKDRADG
ncbi:hypothetical protein K9B35_07520 [Sphingomonas sp. R647]|uniref:hypothetical protein n=1 Tax=Sphingomonas sp. R647 TaxID=2875233 RepID=UPI001CD79637|nr:hypothetical protein [Sphingomonas sp. R647]MCA1197811.1 hypothetical protein [Sphingomonas sp. R647]